MDRRKARATLSTVWLSPGALTACPVGRFYVSWSHQLMRSGKGVTRWKMQTIVQA